MDHAPNIHYMNIHYHIMMQITPQQWKCYIYMPMHSHTGLSIIFRTILCHYREPLHSKKDLLKKYPSLKEVTPAIAPHINFTHPLATTLVDKISGRKAYCKFDKNITENMFHDIIEDFKNYTLLSPLDVFFSMMH